MNKFSLYTLLLSFPILLTPSSANASETAVPNFHNFNVDTVYHGALSQVILKTDDEKAFRARLREAAKQPVNYAGKYVLTTWGCGTGCLYGAVVNKKTGTVTFLPGTFSGWRGHGERVMFHRNSRLLMLAGVINESNEHGLHYYEIVNDTFTNVSNIPVPSRQ